LFGLLAHPTPSSPGPYGQLPSRASFQTLRYASFCGCFRGLARGLLALALLGLST
jgi:hypothetical protein